MPKSQRLKSGPDASDSPDADPPTRAAPGSDTDAILAALKQTEQFVLTKIDSSVMAAAGELHKKPQTDNLARNSERACRVYVGR